MALILGIDTGGTYTDGVVLDKEAGAILSKAKSLTDKEDLPKCIKSCICALKFERLPEISLVCLSTTLATNAIVEGKGCKVGLLQIGKPLTERIPASLCRCIRGRMDIKGRILEEISANEIREAIEEFRGQVDVVAISGYASVRNPAHELRVKELVKEELSVPVACAHELTSQLGYYDRTVTCVLNAQLIPIIHELIVAVKETLHDLNIQAPMMIVKGDGALIQEKIAFDRPIETIFSGPAASITGAHFLTGLKDALIFDMGGTTSDIANMENGFVHIKKEGAKAGNWFTCVNSAEVRTFGLGGDSHIYLDDQGGIEIGPKRVLPLCVAGVKYPHLKQEILNEWKMNRHELCQEKDLSCFRFLKNVPPLVGSNGFERISMTPTDLLHAEGSYCQWDREMAQMGVAIMANWMNITSEEFIKRARAAILERLCHALMQSIDDFGMPLNNKINKPIVAIGAPAAVWVKGIEHMVGAQVIVPEHGEVANAVGAAAGRVMESVRVMIRPDQVTKKFIVYTPVKRHVCNTLEEAKQLAEAEARKQAARAAEVSGGCKTELYVQDIDTEISGLEGKKYIETRITAMALANPIWSSQPE